MKYRSYTFIIILFVLCSHIWAQERDTLPSFESLLNKPYSQKQASLSKIKNHITYKDSVYAFHYLDSLRLFADKHKDKSLALDIDVAEAYYCVLHTILIPKMTVKGESDTYRFNKILKKAEKSKNIPVMLEAYYWLATIAKNEYNDYETTFKYHLKSRDLLKNISQNDYPAKAHILLEMANTYLTFGDYNKAIDVYGNVLESELTPESDNFIVSAKNSLGICYREKGMQDSSNYWFNKVLASKNTPRYLEWEAIASSNLGGNYLTNGDIEKALPLLQHVMKCSYAYSDPGIKLSSGLRLAEISLRLRKTEEAKEYLDTVHNHLIANSSYTSNFYLTLSKYHILKGNQDLAIIYQDSAITTRISQEKATNALLMLRLEQKDIITKQILAEEELSNQKNRIKLVILGFIFVCFFLIVYIILYRKKKHAYIQLVRKSREWAENIPFILKHSNEEKQNDALENEQKIEEQFDLFKKSCNLVEEKSLYKKSDLSLHTLAHMIGTNKNYLSMSINSITKDNFSSFINNYRIKEAIRILNTNEELTFEAIALEIGFSDRITFYRAFKKITGLSPSDFKNNMNN